MRASIHRQSTEVAHTAAWRRSRLFLAVAAVGLPICGLAQSATQSPGLLPSGSLIVSSELPDNFAATLQKMGGRMMDASVAQVTLAGTTTDSKGSRAAQIIVQAPGLMSYREGTSLALTFGGTQFASSGAVPSNQEAILESFWPTFRTLFACSLPAAESGAALAATFAISPAMRAITPGHTGRCGSFRQPPGPD